MDTKTINLVLQGEFNPWCSQAAETARENHIVRRVGTFRSTQVIHREMDNCTNTAATWTWGDNSVTVVDIRPK